MLSHSSSPEEAESYLGRLDGNRKYWKDETLSGRMRTIGTFGLGPFWKNPQQSNFKP